MEPFNWTCRFCGQATTITDPNYSEGSSKICADNSVHGTVSLTHIALACPNNDCRQLTLAVHLRSFTWENSSRIDGEIIHSWPLLPKSKAMVLPEYIPKSIREDYEEACLILRDSPKASATLSRRCLQGIVRDFWKLPKNKMGNLASELEYIKDKVDADTWVEIGAIRSAGNIGAHMEKDVNFVVDVDVGEADLLIKLIETLISEWYVQTHKRKERTNKAKELVKKKEAEIAEAKAASRAANENKDKTS